MAEGVIVFALDVFLCRRVLGVYRKQGRWDEAEQLGLQVMEISKARYTDKYCKLSSDIWGPKKME